MDARDIRDDSEASSAVAPQNRPDADAAQPDHNGSSDGDVPASHAAHGWQGASSNSMEQRPSGAGVATSDPNFRRHHRRHPPAPAPLSGRAPFAEPSGEEDTLDLKKYLRVIYKRRWLIVGIAAIFTCLGLVYTLLQSPTYRGSATIEIKRDVANLNGIGGKEDVDSGGSGEFYQTQYELLKSRALAERIVAKLRLAEQPDFFRDRQTPFSRLKGLVIGTNRAGLSNPEANLARAVGRVREGLSVEPVRNSRVVRVSYDSPSPGYAQEVSNGAVAAFVEMSLERSYEASAHARKFLKERLEDLKLKLEDSERKLVGYAEEKDILTTGDDRTLILVNLEEANSALTAASKERLKHELIWKQLEGSDELPQSLETDAIAKLRSKRADLLVEYQDKLNVFKQGYPGMVQLRAQISELSQQIDSEGAYIKQSMKLEYAAARAQQESLTKQVAELKQEVADYQRRNIEYTILKREVDTNRTLYEGLLQRYKELSVAGGGGNPSNISIVDDAQRPGAPYKPNFKLNLVFALFFGIVSGGLAAFGRELIDDSFTTPHELEQELGLPILGVIPMVEESAFNSQIADRRSPLNEAYRSLRTALQFTTTAGVPRTLLVTSSRPSEGKSSTALSIAQHFALLGIKVLLIDADLRKPSLHKLLGCGGHRGLSNCLVGNASPRDVLQRTDYQNLEFMPAGPLPPDPSELLASAQMASLLAIASERYDLVVIDSAPVSGMADAPILSNYADGTVLVVEAHGAPRTGVADSLKRLHFARADILGIVFNKFNVKISGYGYGYGYGAENYYGYGSDADAEEFANSESEVLADQTKDA